jgi:hypothetical protein
MVKINVYSNHLHSNAVISVILHLHVQKLDSWNLKYSSPATNLLCYIQRGLLGSTIKRVNSDAGMCDGILNAIVFVEHLR